MTLHQLSNICNSESIDNEKLKLSQAMINELCEEFLKTLDACTTNIVGDERDGSTPLVKRSSSHSSFSEPSQLLSLGSYVPPSRQYSGNSNTDSENMMPDLSREVSPVRSPSRSSGEFHAAGVKRTEKLPSTYFLSIADRFEDLFLREEAIPTVAFLGKKTFLVVFSLFYLLAGHERIFESVIMAVAVN